MAVLFGALTLFFASSIAWIASSFIAEKLRMPIIVAILLFPVFLFCVAGVMMLGGMAGIIPFMVGILAIVGIFNWLSLPVYYLPIIFTPLAVLAILYFYAVRFRNWRKGIDGTQE